ncbi:MAG: helix-turn-helix domain-containing protein [Rhodothermales bacterium]|nr:helix-turn-helix domain-containing protein [Rhodothermales bacterium]
MRKASTLEFGRRLRELRESLDVTQAELADAAQMDQSLLSKYEREDVSPSWLQIERLLEALGQSPCALFPDLCAEQLGGDEGFYTMAYFSAMPGDPSGIDTPTALIKVHRESPLVRDFRLPPISKRYILSRADEDTMIPDWYPGDHLIIDTKLEAKVGRIVVGYLDDEPMARRLVRDKKDLLLIASNRNYPPVPFVEGKWFHVGVAGYVVRDMAKRYSGTELE